VDARNWLGALLLAAGPLAAQGPYGATAKPKPADYPVHAPAGDAWLGAEYHVRSVLARGQTIVVQDYLVVEVALYPPPGKPLAVSTGQFTLRLNGKKLLLYAQAPGFVAAALKYPDWERRPTLVATGGIGDAGVIIGRPEQVERFPGDNRPSRTRLPRPPRAPAPEDPSGLAEEEPPKPEELVVEAALPGGEAKGPVSGYLYFAHKGKTKSIRTLELLYEGPGGGATLRLAP
jgi:hypothetical protein